MIIAGSFAALALVFGVLVLRRGTWLDALGYAASLICVCLSTWFALGQARPVWFGHKPGITIISMAYSEGDSIWFWTRDGEAAPVAYTLPWSEKQAADAKQALDQAKKEHGTVKWGEKPGAGKGMSSGGRPGTAGSGLGRGKERSGGRSPGSAGAVDAAGGAANHFIIQPHQGLPPKSANE